MAGRANLQAIAAAVPLLLIAAATAWWLLSDEPVAPVEVPTYRGGPVSVLTASVPAIGDFDREFNVNDDNPFIPYQQRLAERAKIIQNRTKKPTPTSKPPEVADVQIPQLKLPMLASARKDAPECIGIISSDHGDLLLARMPGSSETRNVEVGASMPESADATRSWTLVALEDGNVARFRDPSGAEQIFTIGVLPSGQSAKDASAQPQPGIPAKDPNQGKAPAPANHPLPQGRTKPPQPGYSDRPRGWSPRPQEPGQTAPAPPTTPWGNLPPRPTK